MNTLVERAHWRLSERRNGDGLFVWAGLDAWLWLWLAFVSTRGVERAGDTGHFAAWVASTSVGLISVFTATFAADGCGNIDCLTLAVSSGCGGDADGGVCTAALENASVKETAPLVEAFSETLDKVT